MQCLNRYERLCSQYLGGKFEPSNHRVEYDDYESILQTGVASRLLSLATRDSGERD